MNKDYASPTDILRDIYKDHDINVKSIKGWEHSAAYVPKSNSSDKPEWLALNAVIPTDYRSPRLNKAVTKVRAASKKSTPAKKKDQETTPTSKKRKVVFFSIIDIKCRKKRIRMYIILQRRRRDLKKWLTIA